MEISGLIKLMVCSNCKSRDIISVQSQYYCINCGQSLAAPKSAATPVATVATPQTSTKVPKTPLLDPSHELPKPPTLLSLPAPHGLHYISSALDVAWHGIKEPAFQHLSRAIALLWGLPLLLAAELLLANYLGWLKISWFPAVARYISSETLPWLMIIAWGALIFKWWAESYITYGTAKRADGRPSRRRHWGMIAWRQVPTLAALDILITLPIIFTAILNWFLPGNPVLRVGGVVLSLAQSWFLRTLAVPAVVLGGLNAYPALKVSLAMLKKEGFKMLNAALWIKLLELALFMLALLSGAAIIWLHQHYGVSYLFLLPPHLLFSLWLLGFSFGFSRMYWVGIYHTVVHLSWPERIAHLLGAHTRLRRRSSLPALGVGMLLLVGVAYFYAYSHGNLALR